MVVKLGLLKQGTPEEYQQITKQITKELTIIPILDKLLEYKIN